MHLLIRNIYCLRQLFLHSHNLPAKNGSNILDITDTQIGQTYYDWQTNHGPINRTVAWEDGTLNACWMISVNTAFGDIGTAVAYLMVHHGLPAMLV